jgi:hypothetical protein
LAIPPDRRGPERKRLARAGPIALRRQEERTMSLMPNWSKLIFSEHNVDVPAGKKTTDAYDLALYEEMGNPTRGVLVVTIILNFVFKDGTSSTSPATRLTWAGQEKSDFMDGVKAECAKAWGEQYRLTTMSNLPSVREVGVIFDVRTCGGLSVHSHCHWNVYVTKVDHHETSGVKTGWATVLTAGKVFLDGWDLIGRDKGATMLQRGAVHEFGHILGYRDEYADAEDPNAIYDGDTDSVMNCGEEIRQRHYVFFADWISRRWASKYSGCKRHEWKVNGDTCLATAHV